MEPDLVAQYLSEVKRFPSHVLEGLQVVSLDEHNGIMEVEHGPIEKYRLALLPDRAFSVADLLAQGMSLPAIKKLWKATYCAIGRHLGLEFDTACTARAYYLRRMHQALPTRPNTCRGDRCLLSRSCTGNGGRR